MPDLQLCINTQNTATVQKHGGDARAMSEHDSHTVHLVSTSGGTSVGLLSISSCKANNDTYRHCQHPPTELSNSVSVIRWGFFRGCGFPRRSINGLPVTWYISLSIFAVCNVYLFRDCWWWHPEVSWVRNAVCNVVLSKCSPIPSSSIYLIWYH